MNDRLRQFLIVTFAIAQWISAIAIGSALEGASSDAQTYFIPADITFIVWGFIYTGSTVYAIYQALPSQRERAIHRRIGTFIIANSLLCTLWNSTVAIGAQTPSQPFYLVLTVLYIIGMCYALTRVWIMLRDQHDTLNTADRWLAQVPASIYFAWLNVAVIANTTSLLVAYDLTGEPNGAIWSTAMIIVAVLLTSLMIVYSRPSLGTISYTAVIVWALVGISLGNAEKSALVGTTALIAALIVLVIAALRLSNRPTRTPEQRTAAA